MSDEFTVEQLLEDVAHLQREADELVAKLHAAEDSRNKCGRAEQLLERYREALERIERGEFAEGGYGGIGPQQIARLALSDPSPTKDQE